MTGSLCLSGAVVTLFTIVHFVAPGGREDGPACCCCCCCMETKTLKGRRQKKNRNRKSDKCCHHYFNKCLIECVVALHTHTVGPPDDALPQLASVVASTYVHMYIHTYLHTYRCRPWVRFLLLLMV